MDDNMTRGLVLAAGGAFWLLVGQKARSYLAAKKAKTGRGLAERIGYRLGRLWPRRNHPAQ